MREKITSQQVARLAGVSQSAVSRVFSGASASAQTVRKVREAAEQLGYRPNSLARAMITGKSQLIGLVVAHLDNQFYPMALEKLSRAFQARGYHVLVFFAENATENVEQVVEELLDYQVDAIVPASVSMTNRLTGLCEAAGIPVVMFNRGQDDPRLSEVVTGNYEGGRAVANFLIAGGHDRIAHISGWQGATTGRDRARGFLDGLTDQGHEVFALAEGKYSREVAADAARRMFGRSDRPDALFVGNDHMALAVMDVLRFELGLRIPDDVSVVGFDDVPMAAWPTYDLTTLRQPVNRMVEATVDAVISRVEGATEPRSVVIPGPLILRGSARRPKGLNA